MIPIDFPGRNWIFEKPDDWKDEDCMSIPAWVGENRLGPLIMVAWKPSKEDIDAINRGEPIYMTLQSNVMVPVALYTMDENNQVNT